MHPCDHTGSHSGEGRYSRMTSQLRYVIVCDACQAELRELAAVDYRPEPRLERAALAPAV